MQLIFGGSFDPIHQGHIQSALALLAHLNASSVSFIPNALSPLKQRQSLSPESRRALLELSLAPYPALSLDWREVQRGGSSYTVDTLRQLRREQPQQSLVFVMGQDSFNQLRRWREWQQLTDYAHLLVMARPGYQPDYPEPLAQWLAPRKVEQADSLRDSEAGKVYFCQLPPYPVSSTELREACAAGNWQWASDYLSAEVVNYIQQQGLYQGSA
ncbi:nicotinate-nucleotide adenylyltransferase [Aliagarivorans marinus]|uniref:nicotinate-nucleotide adenylyltransferase n=1 Tax=Aliagarivorans marinus TaxID=561965 RepID=UPI00041CF2C2|nr:nicotinate-nucleotide adenylyltransferase [Aliagarivorans marinus]